jgi:hypothetical protein
LAATAILASVAALLYRTLVSAGLPFAPVVLSTVTERHPPPTTGFIATVTVGIRLEPIFSESIAVDRPLIAVQRVFFSSVDEFLI